MNRSYSKDISEFELGGLSGVIGTIASFVVSPIRVTSRVCHNIILTPPSMLKTYGASLLGVSIATFVLGVLDSLVYGKPYLLLASLASAFIGWFIFKRGARYKSLEGDKRIVQIDNGEIETLCNSIYDEIEEVLSNEF